jgi:hypothetical protein
MLKLYHWRGFADYRRLLNIASRIMIPADRTLAVVAGLAGSVCVAIVFAIFASIVAAVLALR